MRKKQAAIVGLGLVMAVIALLVIWPSFRTKSPEPTRRESSLQPSTERQTPDIRIQPSQSGTAQEEEKRAAIPVKKPKSRAKGADGGASSFSSGSWMMEQQRIGPGGVIKESSISKVWMKGDRKRVDTFRTLGAWSGTALQPTTIVFADREYEYAYYPSERRMLRFPRALGLEALSKKWTKKRSEVRIGSEVVDGKTCETYRVVNDVNVGGLGRVAMEVKECRWKGLVLKEISKPIGSSDGDTLVTQLKDVRLDVFIPDEKFVLPTGVRIEEVKIPPEMARDPSFR